MTQKEYNKAVQEYSGRLYRFLLRSLRHEQNARDLVQDAFVKLWEHREQVLPEKAKAWLFTVAHNLMINFIKKHGRQDYVEEFYIERGVDQNASFEQKDVIDQCMVQLSEQQRTIILLRDLEGYNYKEIGDIMGLNESQVKVYLFRARKKIKDIIQHLSNAL